MPECEAHCALPEPVMLSDWELFDEVEPEPDYEGEGDC